MPRRRLGPALLALVLAVVLTGPGSSAWPEATAGGASIELVAQTAVVAPGETFALRLRLAGVPPEGSIRVVVHQRVRSRSELAQSMDGNGLRTAVYDTATPLVTLSTEADGTRRLALSLDPANGGLPLRAEGVYPVELFAQDAAGSPLAELLTHLVLPPEEGDDAPALGVAVLADIGLPPAFQPDGTAQLPPDDVDDLASLVEGLTARSDAAATLAVTPETLEGLVSSPRPEDVELVDALRVAAAGRAVLALPYVTVSPDDLAAAGLLGELGHQLDRGRQVLTDVLEVDPTGSVALAPPELGADGLAALAFSGVRRLVVSDAQLAPLDDGLISYSLAQPFLVAVPEDTPTEAAAPGDIQALATDPVVLARLHTAGSPGLVASRVLSELAFLRLEQPGVARSVVLPLGPGTPADVVELVLQGLGYGRPFALMELDGAFDHAVPLLDGGGNPVERRLLPANPSPMRAADARALTAARNHLGTFVGLVGTDGARTDPMARHLLVSTAVGLTAAERQDHIGAVEADIEAVTSSVSAPATFTLTLTAREGTIPLTVRNDSGVPLHVSIRLRSQKLEFPEGDTIDQVLTEPTTRIDIAVRARASGAFPLEIEVTSPDGQLRLSRSRYTVRSTAISGAGLVLSVGAGVFLVVWWARHWRRTRRSAKLVAVNGHPAAGPRHIAADR